METTATLEQVLKLAERLPALERVSLIEQLAPRIARDLTSASRRPRKSLRGIWKGVDITDDDLAEVRREMWGNFPRQDL